MSDETTEGPGTYLEVRELWRLQVRDVEAEAWVVCTSDTSDPVIALRHWDWSKDNHPDMKHQLARVLVEITVEDPERLRELLKKAADEKAARPVQSE